ncbi:recQ-mediated instability-like protein [Wolffia australiana]
MDYSLAALKLFCSQLKEAAESPANPTSTPLLTPTASSALYGILFQRAWIQGVLVAAADLGAGERGRFVLDDGTGLAVLSLSKENQQHDDWAVGMYVMAVGQFVPRTGDLPLLKVHKMVDLSAHPDREAVWHLEVVEAYKLFYQSLPED